MARWAAELTFPPTITPGTVHPFARESSAAPRHRQIEDLRACPNRAEVGRPRAEGRHGKRPLSPYRYSLLRPRGPQSRM